MDAHCTRRLVSGLPGVKGIIQALIQCAPQNGVPLDTRVCLPAEGDTSAYSDRRGGMGALWI